MKALSYKEISDLNRILISHGVTVTQKASTVSMVTDTKGKLNITRETGWLSVTDKELTPELQAVIDTYHKELA